MRWNFKTGGNVGIVVGVALGDDLVVFGGENEGGSVVFALGRGSNGGGRVSRGT